MSTTSSTSPLRMAELVAALSLATDLGTGQPMEHALRVCLLAVELGDQLGVGEDERRDVYYIALLRAIGCVADAHRVAARFGDEILANAQISLLDTAHPSDVIGLLLRQVGQNQPTLRRARMILAALAAGPDERNQVIAAHCEVAERLAQRLGMRDGVARGVTQVYERWDGKGSPRRTRGETILRSARIVTLARDAELFYRLDGVEGATHVIRQRAGTLYDPDIAECFVQHASSLLRVLKAEDIWDAALAAEPGPHPVLTTTARETATRAIADFVDLKSPFTAGHSSGVALLAAAAAERLGLGEPEVTTLRQAGYIHDLGRVSISVAIWDKPGPLTASEWELVRRRWTGAQQRHAPSLPASHQTSRRADHPLPQPPPHRRNADAARQCASEGRLGAAWTRQRGDYPEHLCACAAAHAEGRGSSDGSPLGVSA